MPEAKPRWEIILTRQAEKTLYRLPKNLLQHIDRTILALAANPRPPASQPLPGHDHLFRLAVKDWRIAYAVEEERLVVLILEIAPQQQPGRYRLEEELSDEIPPAEATKDLYQAKANMPEALFKVIKAQFLDEQRLEFLNVIKYTHQQKIRLLIVDDMPETRENLRKLLYFEPDMEVVGATTNGEEAVQMAVAQQPDIVLMDIILPGINGLTATEIICQQIPSAQIIMMSVQGDAETFRLARAAGAREFLIKPFSSDELMTSIRRVYQSAALQKSPSTPKTSPIQDVFKDLKERIQAKLLAQLDPTIDISRPNELGRTILQDKFDQILAQENIILSRSERERLFESIVTEILQTELDETQKRAVAQWFKFFKLGNNVEISLSVADLSRSVSFYKKLGFERVDGGEKPYPWAVVLDGRFYLGLHQQVFSSPTLSYFTLHGLSERMDHLPKLGVRLDNIQKLVPIQGMHHNKLLYGLKFITAEFASPEGQRVLLADICSDVETTPSGRKFFSKYEAFGELSLNAKDVNAALAYWEKLGFECLAEGDQPYPWVIISDGRIRLGLHQTSKLTQPTITYFAPDMPERLKRLRRRGVQFVAEHKDKKGRRVGAVIESPDGQRFFLFAGEIRPQKNGQNKDSGRVSQEVYPDKDSSQPEAAQWYMIYSYSGQETKVRQNLLHRVETLGMRDKIFQVVVPSDPSVPLRISGSSFLSGSLLVEMVMDEDSWYVVKNTPGVTGFVGAYNKPTPLPPAEVDKLLKHPKAEAPQINGSFKVGQMVRVVEGPFEDFIGVVNEVDPDRARVRVLVSFFGHEKSIELDFSQVELA